MSKMKIALAAILTAATICSEASAGHAVRNRMLIADEKVIAASPSPSDIFLFTPAIVEGLDGRLVVAVDFGGPGTGKLDGPKSVSGDYESGNQIRVMYSDDKGRTWKPSPARIPMMHEILFKAGNTLYMIGHAGILMASRSDDNGVTWSDPAVLCDSPRWHQSCGSVDIHEGKVTLVYEKFLSDSHPWPGVGQVLMQGNIEDDLTVAANWRFSDLYNPDGDLAAAKPSGVHVYPTTFDGYPAPGILESNVVRVYDPDRPFYDPSGKSVVILTRAVTGFPDIGAMLKGTENPDGSLSITRLHKDYGELFLAHIPGGNLKFHICYDSETKLYWMVHSQIDGRMDERRRLALSYSPDLLSWTFAGLVAVGAGDNQARHYATMCIFGDDICIVSRSGDEKARNSHDADITTFHKVRNFRKLVY